MDFAASMWLYCTHQSAKTIGGGEQQSILMGITGRRGELNPMLEKILSKARHILIDAHQRLSLIHI